MYAKKSLGQHFLKSERALNTIVEAGEITTSDLVLEIGPGEGALTARLVMLAGKVVAVEKDDDLFALLKENFSPEIEAGSLELVHGDILDFDPQSLAPHKNLEYKIIANIPYNITGAIIRKFLSAKFQPERMVLLVQKEVAERIVARNGKESLLSLSVKAYGRPAYIETVKAGSFAPAPKVDSAILRVSDISRDFFKTISEKTFFDAIHAGFASKRKKLSSNLANIFDKQRVEAAFTKTKLDPNVRAEDLALADWRRLLESL